MVSRKVVIIRVRARPVKARPKYLTAIAHERVLTYADADGAAAEVAESETVERPLTMSLPSGDAPVGEGVPAVTWAAAAPSEPEAPVAAAPEPPAVALARMADSAARKWSPCSMIQVD